MEDEFAFVEGSMVVAVEIVVDALTIDVVRACGMVDDSVVALIVDTVVDTVVADDSVVAADDNDDNCSTEVET